MLTPFTTSRLDSLISRTLRLRDKFSVYGKCPVVVHELPGRRLLPCKGAGQKVGKRHLVRHLSFERCVILLWGLIVWALTSYDYCTTSSLLPSCVLTLCWPLGSLVNSQLPGSQQVLGVWPLTHTSAFLTDLSVGDTWTKSPSDLMSPNCSTANNQETVFRIEQQSLEYAELCHELLYVKFHSLTPRFWCCLCSRRV